MSAPVEHVPPRPVLVPVLIAAVCLAVIGGSVGYLWTAGFRLGGSPQRPVADGSSAPSAPATPMAAPAASASSAAPEGSAAPSSGPPSSGPPSPRPAPSPKNPYPGLCRQELQDYIAAGRTDVGDAFLKLRIRTAQGTTALICANDSGEYYYFGSRDPEDVYWENGVNALLLPGVAVVGKDTFVAKVQEPDGSQTKITVTRKEWRWENPGKPTVVENVVGGG